jgi:proline racemase/trans-L-3-hydroxyproline dehydratase
MKVRRLVQVVDTHTAGEPTRVVVGGFPAIPGETMGERKSWLAHNADEFREFLLQEPRGHGDMFGAIVTPPATQDGDLGLIFLESSGYLGMCGHGTIGALTALAAVGQIEKEEVRVDTPSGRVLCRLTFEERELVSVTFQNVLSFGLDPLEKDGLEISIAYGGNLFALVDARRAGLRLEREALPDLVREGLSLRQWVNDHRTFRHPATGDPLRVELVEFYEEGDPPKNVVVFGKGQVDRSPCGTGTCAKMALLHAKGKLEVGGTYRYRSILDTEFVGRIVAEAHVGGRRAILPEVTGVAFVTGIGSLVLTEGDPFPSGFRLIV